MREHAETRKRRIAPANRYFFQLTQVLHELRGFWAPRRHNLALFKNVKERVMRAEVRRKRSTQKPHRESHVR